MMVKRLRMKGFIVIEHATQDGPARTARLGQEWPNPRCRKFYQQLGKSASSLDRIVDGTKPLQAYGASGARHNLAKAQLTL